MNFSHYVLTPLLLVLMIASIGCSDEQTSRMKERAEGLTGGERVTALTGQVVDLSSRAPLTEAQVCIQNTTQCASADETGTYTLSGLGAPEQVLEVTSPGYTTATQSITIAANETTTQDFALTAESSVDPVFATGLNSPMGITQLTDGRVLVVEYLTDKVTAIAADGTKSDFATGLNRPTGITQLTDGRVLVAEAGSSNKVSAFAAK